MYLIPIHRRQAPVFQLIYHDQLLFFLCHNTDHGGFHFLLCQIFHQLLSIFHDYKQAAGCIKQIRIDIEELADFDCLLPDWYIHMLYLKALIHPDAHLHRAP